MGVTFGVRAVENYLKLSLGERERKEREKKARVAKCICVRGEGERKASDTVFILQIASVVFPTSVSGARKFEWPSALRKV